MVKSKNVANFSQDEIDTLNPVRAFVYSLPFKRKGILRVRALTMREILEVGEGLANFWQLSIGRPETFLKTLKEKELIELQEIVAELNEPPKPAKAAKKKAEQTKMPDEDSGKYEFKKIFNRLTRAGHNPERLLDYTMRQLLFWNQIAIAEMAEKSDEWQTFIAAVSTAVWGDKDTRQKLQRSLENQSLAIKNVVLSKESVTEHGE